MCKHDEITYVWLDGKLKPIDRCIAILVLQLNLAGIKTIDSCCAHGKGYPSVLCAQGTEEALKEFGCEIIMTREDGVVDARFPTVGEGGFSYAVEQTFDKEIRKPKLGLRVEREFENRTRRRLKRPKGYKCLHCGELIPAPPIYDAYIVYKFIITMEHCPICNNLVLRFFAWDGKEIMSKSNPY